MTDEPFFEVETAPECGDWGAGWALAVVTSESGGPFVSGSDLLRARRDLDIGR